MDSRPARRRIKVLRAETRLVLIEHVQRYEYLWNIKHPQFFDRRLKVQTWQNISNEMQETTHTLRRVWENLRDHYRRELKREQRNGIKSKWRYFHEMEFVRSCIRPREDDSHSESEKAKEESGQNANSNLIDDNSPTILTLITTSPVASSTTSTNVLQMQLPATTKLTLVKPFKPLPKLNLAAESENPQTAVNQKDICILENPNSNEYLAKSVPDNMLQQINDVMKSAETIKRKTKSNVALNVRKDVIRIPKFMNMLSEQPSANGMRKIQNITQMTQTEQNTITTGTQTDDIKPLVEEGALDENMKFFFSLQNDLRKLSDKHMLKLKFMTLQILVDAGKEAEIN